MFVKIGGALDPHTHLRDLDWINKGDFESETKAALFGGYWAVLDMPNTSPSTITPYLLNKKKQIIKQKAYCDWGLYFGASRNDNFLSYDKVINECSGLKIYTNYTTGDLLIDDKTIIENHFKYWNSNKIIAVHAEDDNVLMILDFVRKYKRHTHFVHISTKKEIDYLKQAKEEGLPISLGVCPHHLYFTEKDLKHLGAYGLMKPSLKTETDKNALWEALKNGLIDILESDHAPHTIEEKKQIPRHLECQVYKPIYHFYF